MPSELPSTAVDPADGARLPLRYRAALRWLAVPWSEFALASALVLAFAIPVLLVGSVDVWRGASQDDLTDRSVADVSLERNGADVVVESSFSRSAVEAADGELTDAMVGIPQLDDPVRTVYTLPGIFTVGPPPVREVGPVARLLSQAGANRTSNWCSPRRPHCSTAGGITTIVATHDRRVLDRVGEVVELRDGAVATITTGGERVSVIDRSGRLQLPPELRERFPHGRARLRWTSESDHIEIDRP